MRHRTYGPAARLGAVSPRVQLAVTAAPVVAVGVGVVRSCGAGCEPTPDCAAVRYQGYGAFAQTYIGLVYYP